ncbi:SGNH/GDSL hydrolase family protein, partial [Bacteroides ovatus]|uniref:SGNH/GDSL hydrolase family protein n=1 Tax=Bacteroides ovatus TaxID=28116 RepID=UPI0039B3EE4C
NSLRQLFYACIIYPRKFRISNSFACHPVINTLKEIFNRLKKENEKNIILISSKNMLGEDGEATIDGIHFTDLGMMRYADLVCPIIKKAIK